MLPDAFKTICEVNGITQECKGNNYLLFKNVIKDLDLALVKKLTVRLHDSDDEYISDESNEEN